MQNKVWLCNLQLHENKEKFYKAKHTQIASDLVIPFGVFWNGCKRLKCHKELIHKQGQTTKSILVYTCTKIEN